MSEICIIIPCYNEEKRLSIKEFLDYLEKTTLPVSFCFVDDGSTDQTLALLNKLAAIYENRVSIHKNPKNLGKAESVRQGVLTQLKGGKYKYIGYFDADLATPLSEIDNFMNVFALEPEIQMVMGSRIKKLGSSISRLSSRHIFGRTFATAASLLLNLDVYDTQCGAKILARELALKVFAEKFRTQWLFDLEILARMKQQELSPEKISYEIPLKMWEDIGGSKIKLSYLFRIPFDLLQIYKSYLRN